MRNTESMQNYRNFIKIDQKQIQTKNRLMNLTNLNKKGETRNITGILKFFGFNRWEVKYLKGHNEVIPHEIVML